MDVQRLAAALLEHFDRHRRDMPWRRTRDPYAIWVSEVMLQQTRVDAAVPYYERWMRRFPSIQALAEAELDDVLHAWQGLGYYSRARNLHRAARLVRERHGGALPADPTSLRELPGVGEYTAGAVASIAFDVPTPAVDGNVRRVLCRLHDLGDARPAALRRLAAALVPADRPGDFNQALMELGATICTPRSPSCDACPVRTWCRAAARGTQAVRPRPKRRGPLPEEALTTLVLVVPEGRVLVARRPSDGLLAGLWEFPAAGTVALADRLAAAGREIASLETVVHTFSHKRIAYRPRLVAVTATAPVETVDAVEAAWVAAPALEQYAMPVAQRRIARLAAPLVAEVAGGGRG